MKKLISSFTVCALAVCSITSCMGSQKLDTEIVGKWSSDDTSTLPSNIDGFGFIFSENGKGSVYEDISSIMHFTDSGLNVGGTIFGDEFLNASGDVISFDIADQKFLSMTRVSFGSSRYDGVYTLTGGMLYDTLAAGLADENDISMNNLNVTLEFDGDHSELILNDVFTYTANGRILSLEGMAGTLAAGEKGYLRYDIDGDTLTTKGKRTQTHKRIK